MDQYQNSGSEKSMYPQVSYGTNPTAPYNKPPPQQMNNFGPPSQQTSMTTVVVTQPQQVKNDLMVASLQRHRNWSTGLFDCFQDMGVCLFTWCYYSCAVCMLGSRTGGECFCTPACVPASDITLRTRTRTLDGIQGSMCNDCMVVTCCGPCAACQKARELTNMGVP